MDESHLKHTQDENKWFCNYIDILREGRKERKKGGRRQEGRKEDYAKEKEPTQ